MLSVVDSSSLIPQNRAVRQLQLLGKIIAPFMESVSEMLADKNENSVQHILIMAIIRILAIAGCIGAFYLIAQIVNTVFGRDFVVESKVIVVHDDDDDINKRDEPEKKSRPRRTARAKKEE